MKHTLSRHKTAIVTLIGAALIAAGIAKHWPDPLGEVTVLTLHGEVAPGRGIDPDRVVESLRGVCASPNVRTVVLRLDSDGGDPTGQERIVDTLDRHCGEREVVAVVESACTSACYGIAIAADRIVASGMSYVGGIGAMVRWYDHSAALAAAGVREETIASGPLKGGAGITGTLSPAQREDVARMVDTLGREFVASVKARRGDRLRPDVDLEAGGLYAASEAEAIGLVDARMTLEQLLEVEFAGKDVTHLAREATGTPTGRRDPARERAERAAAEAGGDE